ncbi:hypothetical protein IHE61_30580 [Streptomyces sp. GKU 257-1]|nr:hypothetical protein [Streptomyces sp. GKU 257-1]
MYQIAACSRAAAMAAAPMARPHIFHSCTVCAMPWRGGLAGRRPLPSRCAAWPSAHLTR